MQAGVAQYGSISPVLFSLYVNYMPSPCRHVDLVLYAHTIVIATSRQPALLDKYLETSQRLRAVVKQMDRHQRLEEVRYALRQDWLAHFETPRTAIRRAIPIGQRRKLSWGNP